MHVEKEVPVSVSKVNSSSESVVTASLGTRMVSDELGDTLAHNRAGDVSGASYKVFFEDVLEHSVGGGTGDSVARVSRSDTDRVCLEVIENFLFYSDSGEWGVSSSDSLSEGVHIRDDTRVVLETEHFTGTSESLHDFIGDEHNSVLITESTDTLHESVVHLQPSVGSSDGLEDNTSDLVRSFE